MNRQSMSISPGEIAGRAHNIEAEYRAGLKNAKKERAIYNTVLRDGEIKDVYHARFSRAVAVYNEAQASKGHPERRIADYLEKIRASKQEKASYELVIQIGSQETFPATDPENRKVATAVYTEVFNRFEEKYKHFDVVRAAIHNDEATPHMHIEYVPWADGQKRGVSCRNSHTRALAQMGFKTVGDLNDDMFRMFEDVARGHGIERVDMGVDRGHLSVRDFKQMCAEAERRGGDYPYRNDPRLLKQVETLKGDLAEAVGVIEGQNAVLRAVAEERNPIRLMGLAKEAGEACRASEGPLERLRGRLVDLREMVASIPTFWREHIINPVSDRLREARERYTAPAPAEPDRDEGDFGCDLDLEGRDAREASLLTGGGAGPRRGAR